MAGFGKRLSNAFKCFFSILGSGSIPPELAREVAELPMPPPAISVPPSPPPRGAEPESMDRAVQILALLQRDARFVDFVTEEIAGYSDAQIGAAVRSVHDSCRKVFNRYLTLEPILPAEEGATVTVDGSTDPAEVKLIGNVRAGTEARGVVQHRGWRVASANLPPLPEGAARRVVAQAEVEVP